MIITHHLDMDLVRQPLQLQIPVSAVQGDANTRVVTLTLYQDGTAWEVPAGTTAAVAFHKPDGHKGLYDALPDGTPAVTLSGNTLTAILAPQALTCAGEVLVSVVLWDEQQDQLATFPFRVRVAANPAAGAQVSDNYYKLQNLEQVNAAYDALLEHVEFLTEQVEAGIGVTDEQIAAVVETYLEENPPEVAPCAPSDWNVNDENDRAYVKNRPFYAGDIVEAELCDINAMATTAESEWVENSGIMMNGYAVKESEAFIFDGIIEIGKEYAIVANGEKRIYVAEDGGNYDMAGVKMIGDAEAFAANDMANLNMILLMSDAAEMNPDLYGKSIMYISVFGGNTAPTEYKLYSREQEIIKLDPKYLPDLPEYISKPTQKVILNFSDMKSSMTPTEIVDAVNQGFDVIFGDSNGSSNCRWWDISGNSVGLIISEDGSPVLYKIDSSGNLLRVNGLELKPTSGTYITNTSADQTYAKKSELKAVSDLVGTTSVFDQINAALGVIENGTY